ncbi:MAG TPA: NADH-ubiquinone oxidoreductase-F iron-sulfur binding region domain-containing protein [Acidimicrobiales bacterium]|nr:NADH-ubiquinone oxidoreductase-F iron-sulfur binding region domain-containing protein [Acidimicrobiales bacterium]
MLESTQLPRLLSGTPGTPRTLVQHEEAFRSSFRTGSLLDELEASGLTGRGGAAFPTGIKARFLRDQRGHHKYVVVNAMEGEPASHKDLTLLSTNPHLVLDGAEILASIVGASRIAVAVARDNPVVVNHVKRALHERERRSKRGAELELHTPPWRYVAGEESALVHWLDDNESLPQYRPRRPHVLKIGHDPVMLDNAETCANVGLIGRYGAQWFRGLGPSTSPGTQLASVTGAVARPTVLEVVLGTPLRQVLAAAGADTNPQAVLLGGYGGSWLSGDEIDVAYDNASLAPRGVSVGAGVLVVVPREACGILETQRVVRWMANESARQCGPCAFGLPALADDLTQIVQPTRDAPSALRRLVERANVIEGRGACHHPDGVVRFVRSALNVFRHDVDEHVRGNPCAASRTRQHFTNVPTLEREEELIWE